MANGNVAIPANTWTQIADGGLGVVSWQVKSPGTVYIAATSANSEPTGDFDEWPAYGSLQGEAGINALDLFSGVPGAAYLWAYSPGKTNEIWRSHA